MLIWSKSPAYHTPLNILQSLFALWYLSLAPPSPVKATAGFGLCWNRNILENAGKDNISSGDIFPRIVWGLGVPTVGSRVWQPGTIPHPSQKWAPGQGHPWESSSSLGKDRMRAHLWQGPWLGRARPLGVGAQLCCSITAGAVRPWGPGHEQGDKSPGEWAGTGRPFIALKAMTYLNLTYLGNSSRHHGCHITYTSKSGKRALGIDCQVSPICSFISDSISLCSPQTGEREDSEDDS